MRLFIFALDNTGTEYNFSVNAISHSHATRKAEKIIRGYDRMPKRITVYSRQALPDTLRNKPFETIKVKL